MDAKEERCPERYRKEQAWEQEEDSQERTIAKISGIVAHRYSPRISLRSSLIKEKEKKKERPTDYPQTATQE